MSVAGIFSSSLMNYLAPGVQSKTQAAQSSTSQFQQEFQQLGQDLQSGNLSSAQADFQGLQGRLALKPRALLRRAEVPLLRSSINSPRISSTKTEIPQLRSRTTPQFSRLAKRKTADGHHHHHHGGGSENAVSQSLDQIGQALQAGNLSAAQQAYSSLQREPSAAHANQRHVEHISVQFKQPCDQHLTSDARVQNNRGDKSR